MFDCSNGCKTDDKDQENLYKNQVNITTKMMKFDWLGVQIMGLALSQTQTLKMLFNCYISSWNDCSQFLIIATAINLNWFMFKLEDG